MLVQLIKKVLTEMEPIQLFVLRIFERNSRDELNEISFMMVRYILLLILYNDYCEVLIILYFILIVKI